jgi:hypothetical protein
LWPSIVPNPWRIPSKSTPKTGVPLKVLYSWRTAGTDDAESRQPAVELDIDFDAIDEKAKERQRDRAAPETEETEEQPLQPKTQPVAESVIEDDFVEVNEAEVNESEGNESEVSEAEGHEAGVNDVVEETRD